MRKRTIRNKRLLLAIFASFALGLTSLAHGFAGEKGDLQAPRGMQVPREGETQAPRGQDTQAPRDDGTQAPRSSGDTVRGA